MPSSDDVIASLNDADQAADAAYRTARDANPDGDLSAVHRARMRTADALASAINKALNADPGVAVAQRELDAASADIRQKLATLKEVAACLATLSNLASQAIKVAGFFV